MPTGESNMKTISRNRFVILTFVVVLAGALLSLGACASQGGSGSSDEVDSSTVAASQIHANVIVIGPSNDGTDASWISLPAESFDDGVTALAATKTVLDEGQMTYQFVDGSSKSTFTSITSPYDDKPYAEDQATGKYWRLFINGAAVDASAGSMQLADGDTVAWYYSADGAALPSVGTGI